MEENTSKEDKETSFLTCWYQPIYRIDTGEIFGYEALTRGKLQENFFPAEVLEKARSNGCHTILDCELLLKAHKTFKNTAKGQLFLNILPSTMTQSGFLCWWDKHFENTDSLVLEISESEAIEDWQALRYIVNSLKERGVKIAIDDMGSGFSFLRHWVELEPDYVKLDKYYMSDLAQSTAKQRILHSFIDLIGDTTNIVVEGIEEIKGFEIVKGMGIKYGQGYLLGMPASIEDYIGE
jgi:EAL domain-containing protein (putative c-di-GMP-specific phosphodiesterase class I)